MLCCENFHCCFWHSVTCPLIDVPKFWKCSFNSASSNHRRICRPLCYIAWCSGWYGFTSSLHTPSKFHHSSTLRVWSAVQSLRPSWTAHGISQAGILGWGIFPTQRLNPCLLHCQQVLHQCTTREAPSWLYRFSRSVLSDSATPWPAARQASLSTTKSGSLLKLMSIESVLPSNHLILCHICRGHICSGFIHDFFKKHLTVPGLSCCFRIFS